MRVLRLLRDSLKVGIISLHVNMFTLMSTYFKYISPGMSFTYSTCSGLLENTHSCTGIILKSSNGNIQVRIHQNGLTPLIFYFIFKNLFIFSFKKLLQGICAH